MYAAENFVNAMELNKLVKIAFLSSDGMLKTSICIPLDFSMGKTSDGRAAQYFCWDNESSPRLLQIPVCCMQSVEMLEERFDPSVLKYLMIDEDDTMWRAAMASNPTKFDHLLAEANAAIASRTIEELNPDDTTP